MCLTCICSVDEIISGIIRFKKRYNFLYEEELPAEKEVIFLTSYVFYLNLNTQFSCLLKFDLDFAGTTQAIEEVP